MPKHDLLLQQILDTSKRDRETGGGGEATEQLNIVICALEIPNHNVEDF